MNVKYAEENGNKYMYAINSSTKAKWVVSPEN